MNREQAIAVVRKYEPELKAEGVLGVSIFGSTARGENGPDSDVDVAVRLAENFSIGGLAYFGRLDELQHRLSRLLGCSVHVIEEPAGEHRLQAEIDRDRALAFQQSSPPTAGHLMMPHGRSAVGASTMSIIQLYYQGQPGDTL